MRTKRKVSSAVLLAAAAVLAGCSPKVTGPQTQTIDSAGMSIQASVRPGLPQDSGTDSPNATVQTGDNTLIITLRDTKTNAPIGDANITAAPSTSLVGVEQAQSGRAQGNGVYFVPIRFAVPDTFKVIVTVDRPEKPETTVTFKFTAQQ